ncbi:hypothetical protein ACJX0J_015000, partial [Zea mays]
MNSLAYFSQHGDEKDEIMQASIDAYFSQHGDEKDEIMQASIEKREEAARLAFDPET